MARDRPLIGIFTSEVRPARTIRRLQEGEPVGCEIALSQDYVDAVTAAGGLPMVLPPLDESLAGTVLDRLEAICLSGGPDVDPSIYGAPRHQSVARTDAELDRFEIELARIAVERDMPLLAICRGMQVFNVSRGGTLIQHLPEHEPATLNHRQDHSGNLPGHEVRLDGNALVARVIGTDSLEVNTFHHQGVAGLGDDIEPVGWADDGLVEAIEIPDRTFAIGVQWHAELMAEREFESALFSGFVESAREYGRARPQDIRS